MAHGDASDPAAAAASEGSHHSMSMPMSFEWSTHTVLWFPQWQTHGPISYALALAVVAALGVAHEALNARRLLSLAGAGGGGSGAASAAPPPLPAAFQTPRGRAAAYALSLATSYLLMLAVMTYNVGVFCAVVGGMAGGFFLFGMHRSAGAAGGGGGSGGANSSSSSSRARLLAAAAQQDPCCPAGV